jgi:hypothetical protein
MKIIKTLLSTAVVTALHFCSFAQTWSGSTPGNIYYNSGKVGIGTNSLPSNGALQIKGPVDIISINNSGAFRIYDGTSFAGGIGSEAWPSAGAGNNLDFAVYAPNNMNIYGGGQKRISILSSGNVGIGTTSPTRQLEIVSGAGVGPLKVAGPNGSLLIDNVGSGESYYQANSFHQFQGSSGTPLMTIFNSGNIGVGTTAPGTYRLAVNGGIHSQSVNVDLTGWSDYVFKQGYTLPSLTEVKTYIDQNHHLPDMPSEQEVIKDGLNLGEMNKLLVKKVEELTLYLIEKDKQVQEEQLRIKKLEDQMQLLLIEKKN